MENTDSLTDKEFNPLFERVASTINLKGCASKEDIDERLDSRIDSIKARRKTLRERGVYSKSLDFQYHQIKNLKKHGFSERTIDAAIARPREKVALTLKYGLRKAKEICLHRKHRRVGRERHRVRNRRSLR